MNPVGIASSPESAYQLPPARLRYPPSTGSSRSTTRQHSGQAQCKLDAPLRSIEFDGPVAPSSGLCERNNYKEAPIATPLRLGSPHSGCLFHPSNDGEHPDDDGLL